MNYYIQEMNPADLESVEALRVEYVALPCGAPDCDCHLDNPYAVLGVIGEAVFLFSKHSCAREASYVAERIRNETGHEYDWPILMSGPVQHIHDVEEASHACLVTKNKHHKEDWIKPESNPEWN